MVIMKLKMNFSVLLILYFNLSIIIHNLFIYFLIIINKLIIKNNFYKIINNNLIYYNKLTYHNDNI